MRSKDKLSVVARRMQQYDNKLWVFVRFQRYGEDRDWIPSFEDLFRIIQAICYCEDDKYPNGKGREMVREFLERCCDREVAWEALREEFEIPDRARGES